jgi:hypothetical protein
VIVMHAPYAGTAADHIIAWRWCNSLSIEQKVNLRWIDLAASLICS